MNRKNNRRKAFWIMVFVVLVGLSGLGLASSGNFENPLGALIGGSGEGGQRGGPSAGAGNQPPAQGAGQRGEGGDQSSISWSAIGGVLYNVWYLFAAAAVVIIVQTVGGGLSQMIKRRLPKAASP
ncbi:MAG: hypothetical protein GC179_25015 [Anaerolineaceae bacterium]|nr:hypothetical protein [Anaerolineaceae bacterium]